MPQKKLKYNCFTIYGKHAKIDSETFHKTFKKKNHLNFPIFLLYETLKWNYLTKYNFFLNYSQISLKLFSMKTNVLSFMKLNNKKNKFHETLKKKTKKKLKKKVSWKFHDYSKTNLISFSLKKFSFNFFRYFYISINKFLNP